MNAQLNSTDSVELEIVRESLRKDIAMVDALEWLKETDQFKLLINEGFIVGTVAKFAPDLLSMNEFVSKSALDKIKAAKSLEAFFEHINNVGMAAKMDLAKGVE